VKLTQSKWPGSQLREEFPYRLRCPLQLRHPHRNRWLAMRCRRLLLFHHRHPHHKRTLLPRRLCNRHRCLPVNRNLATRWMRVGRAELLHLIPLGNHPRHEADLALRLLPASERNRENLRLSMNVRYSMQLDLNERTRRGVNGVFALVALTMSLIGCVGNPQNAVSPNRNATSQSDAEAILRPNEAASAPRFGSALPSGTANPRAGETLRQEGTGLFVRPPLPFKKKEIAADGPVSFSFENGDIREITKNVLGDLLGENFIVDPQVQGTLTIRTARPIKKSDAFGLLESVLRANGFLIVRDGNYWRVTPVANATRGIVKPNSSIDWIATADRSGAAVVIYQPQFVGAKELARLLEPFTRDPTATMRVEELRNWVFFTGSGIEIERLVEIAQMFDVSPLEGMSFSMIQLKNSEAKTVAADWEKVVGTAQINPFAGLVRVVAIERINAILIVTPQPTMLAEAEKWIERLDQAGETGGGQRLFVFYLKYTQADKLQPLLSQAISGRAQTPAQAATVAPGQQQAAIATPFPGQPNIVPGNSSGSTGPGAASGAVQSSVSGTSQQRGGVNTPASGGIGVPSRNVTVVADKDRNALLILATQSEYGMIEAVIKKLDVPPKQVAIEVQIAEVVLTGDFQFGLQSFFEGKLNGSQNRMTSADGIGSVAKGVFTYTWKKSDTIKAILNLSEEKRLIRTLAQPTLITLENLKASFNAGTQISVRTQTQSNTGTTTGTVDSFQYIPTGITLNVTPRVSGNLVIMELQQEISDAGVAAAGNPNPPITKRSASTTVMVQSGDTMLMGGLFQEGGRTASDGLPILSSIPVIGGAFGSQRWQSDRTELVLLITPRVLHDAADTSAVVEELRKRMRSIESIDWPVSTRSDYRSPLKGEPAQSEQSKP
jgi:general secretion pathway protein D